MSDFRRLGNTLFGGWLRTNSHQTLQHPRCGCLLCMQFLQSPAHVALIKLHAFWQLEYDTFRSGDFSPLKHLPLNKVAVLGLVTTKNPKVGMFFNIQRSSGRVLTVDTSARIHRGAQKPSVRGGRCHDTRYPKTFERNGTQSVSYKITAFMNSN